MVSTECCVAHEPSLAPGLTLATLKWAHYNMRAAGHAWRRRLLPPGTPSTTWAERLASAGAEREAAAELARLADDLHYLRYAPQLSATAALQREAVERSRRLLRRLR